MRRGSSVVAGSHRRAMGCEPRRGGASGRPDRDPAGRLPCEPPPTGRPGPAPAPGRARPVPSPDRGRPEPSPVLERLTMPSDPGRPPLDVGGRPDLPGLPEPSTSDRSRRTSRPAADAVLELRRVPPCEALAGREPGPACLVPRTGGRPVLGPPAALAPPAASERRAEPFGAPARGEFARGVDERRGPTDMAHQPRWGGTENGESPRTRRGLSQRKPAATYSPRGSIPKYHRRWRA